MRVYYQGEDVTKYVHVNLCEHETFAERKADSLRIRFVDSKGVWNSWGPCSGDVIRITEDAADTGRMFVKAVLPENGLIAFYATSMPPTGNIRKNRTWENFRLLEIGSDIAAEHGLSFVSYGVTDQIYTYICQENVNDFDFYQLRCLIEGCAMVIYDNSLVVYDERQKEAEAATTTIKIGVDGVFSFMDGSVNAYHSAEVPFGDYIGVAYDDNVDNARVLRPKSTIECSSREESLRFARGILRYANKNQYTGYFIRKMTCDFAAGSIFNLTAEKCSAWNGRALITRTRTDYVKGSTKIFFRRINLEGY